MAQMDERTNFFVGWATLSLINAGLAQSKGRSGTDWDLVGVGNRNELDVDLHMSLQMGADRQRR